MRLYKELLHQRTGQNLWLILKPSSKKSCSFESIRIASLVDASVFSITCLSAVNRQCKAPFSTT